MNSTELVRELVAGGMSRAAIGRAVGRNDSLIGQVERGVKPGRNLTGALQELRDRLAGGESARAAARPVAAEPARRTTARGTAAKTRVRRSKRGQSYTARNIGKAGAARGGRSALPDVQLAADNGRRLSLELEFRGRVSVPRNAQGKSPTRGGRGVRWTLDPDELLEAAGRHGGSVTAGALELLAADGCSGWSGPGDVVGLAVNTWEG